MSGRGYKIFPRSQDFRDNWDSTFRPVRFAILNPDITVKVIKEEDDSQKDKEKEKKWLR